ncbi:MAG: uracil-DNA glycosylase family protein [Chitinophagaceae bacterium]
MNYTVCQVNVTGVITSVIAGPFPDKDYALASMGFDEHSYILADEEYFAFWQPELGKWQLYNTVHSEPPTDAVENREEWNKLWQDYHDTAEDLPLTITLVPGYGNKAKPALMVVGDYPEDCDGKMPFTGEQGEILMPALVSAGFRKKDTYLTTLVKHAKETSKTKLTAEELRRFVPLLLAEISIVQPQAVMLLGLDTAKAVLNKSLLDTKVAFNTTYTFPSARSEAVRAARFYVGYSPKFIIHAGESHWLVDKFSSQFAATKRK